MNLRTQKKRKTFQRQTTLYLGHQKFLISISVEDLPDIKKQNEGNVVGWVSQPWYHSNCNPIMSGIKTTILSYKLSLYKSRNVDLSPINNFFTFPLPFLYKSLSPRSCQWSILNHFLLGSAWLESNFAQINSEILICLSLYFNSMHAPGLHSFYHLTCLLATVFHIFVSQWHLSLTPLLCESWADPVGDGSGKGQLNC